MKHITDLDALTKARLIEYLEAVHPASQFEMVDGKLSLVPPVDKWTLHVPQPDGTTKEEEL